MTDLNCFPFLLFHFSFYIILLCTFSFSVVSLFLHYLIFVSIFENSILSLSFVFESLFTFSFSVLILHTVKKKKQKKKKKQQARKQNKQLKWKQNWTKTKIETKTETSKTNWRSWRGRLSCFAISLHHTAPYTWLTDLLLQVFSKFPFFLLEYFSRKFNNSLQNTQYSNGTRKDANQSNKVKTYRKFKTIDNNKCEDYLHQVTNTRHKITLTKLRLSNHKLATGTCRTLFETV